MKKTNVGRFLKAMPDARPYAKAEAERKKRELLQRNQGFALTVVAGILTILVIACTVYKLDGHKTLLETYYNPIDRADMTTMFDAYKNR